MAKLGNIAKIEAGQGAPQGEQYYSDTGLPFIRAGHLLDLVSGSEEDTIKKIEENVAKNHKLKVFPEDTILFAKSGMSCLKGHVYRLKNKCYVVNHLACIIPRKDLVYPAYLKYTFVFSPPNRLIKDEAYPSISLNDISNMIISLPPLETQQKIADVLDRAGALIEKRKVQIEKLDLLIKSQFIEMFGDPVTNPKGWETKKLKDLFDVSSSKRIYQKDLTTSGVPFIRVSDLVQRIVNNIDSCELFMSEEQYNYLDLKGLVPKPDDILVTSRGTLGLCYIVRSADRFYFQDGMISWLKKKETKIDSTYIVYLFKTHGFRKQLDAIPTGTTVSYLSIAQLEKMNIIYPDDIYQTKFADFVQQVEAQKSLLQQSLEKLELNYKSLMQKCFRGDLF